MKKRCKIIMLPTEKAENSILKHRNGKLQYFGNKYFTQDYLIETERKSFQMYLVSNELLYPGDLAIREKTIRTADMNNWHGDYKIVATTDKSLSIKPFANRDIQVHLPCIPQSFIQFYVEANGKIDEVEVEYEQKRWGNYSKNMNSESINHTVKDYLIVTESNEVIISLKEEDKLYNINDIKKLIELYNTTYIDGDINKWIKENL